MEKKENLKKFDILEIGCGDGKYGFLLRKFLKRILKIILVLILEKR